MDLRVISMLTVTNMAAKITIEGLREKLIPLIGQKFHSPTSRNKGQTGILLEKLTGIPQTSDCLDCCDGELKTFPVRRLKSGKYSPKESMAVTMLSRTDIVTDSFESSRVFKKLQKMLCVPYERTNDTIVYFEATLIDFSNKMHADIYKKLEADYEMIRQNFIKSGCLKSSIGKLLQNRTKGAGHGSVTRAFYLRPLFMKTYVAINSE